MHRVTSLYYLSQPMTMLSKLLLPFSWLYGFILWLRHALYNTGVFTSHGKFEVPVICVGNLNLGGTGKTPFTEYLIKQLSQQFNIGIVSRGYGRETSGYLMATTNSTAKEIGDEPLQMYSKYTNLIKLAVCEDRTSGIQQLLKDQPQLQLIILDDAFQHRKVKADINILLTPYTKPYYNDYLLPAGKLRDIKSAANRADMLVFTKCPTLIQHTEETRAKLPSKLAYNSWFSRIDYLNWIKPGSAEFVQHSQSEALVVTGIAEPSYLIKYVESQLNNHFGPKLVRSIPYPDHHKYSIENLEEIASLFDTFASAEKAIITTEKDWVKLAPLLENHHSRNHWIVVPIAFQLEQEEIFLAKLNQKIAEAAAPR